MVINLAPSEFQRKLDALRAKSKTLVANGNTGMLSNSDVTLSYSYDGVAALTVTVLQRHSFKAKLATEGLIEKSIAGIFATL
ncbi:MAG TPA: hypothetical protein VGD64_16780 [Acidisarcina sp.]